MNKEEMLTIEQVAVLIGSSVNTINMWYRYKQLHPESEYSIILPEFTRIGGVRGTRYWNKNDLWKLIEFKQVIPQGRAGVMADVTQKYNKRKENEPTEEK